MAAPKTSKKYGGQDKLIRAAVVLGIFLSVTSAVVSAIPAWQAEDNTAFPAAADADSDDINNDFDVCLGTAAGESVDPSGCSTSDYLAVMPPYPATGTSFQEGDVTLATSAPVTVETMGAAENFVSLYVSGQGAGEVTFVISGLSSNKTYYIYEGAYLNKQAASTNGSGTLTFSKNLTSDVLTLTIQDVEGTYHFADATFGADCAAAGGTHDGGLTCTFNGPTGALAIHTTQGQIYNGNNKLISITTGYAITVDAPNNTIKNFSMFGGAAAVSLGATMTSKADNTRLENIISTGTNWYAINASGVDNLTLKNIRVNSGYNGVGINGSGGTATIDGLVTASLYYTGLNVSNMGNLQVTNSDIRATTVAVGAYTGSGYTATSNIDISNTRAGGGSYGINVMSGNGFYPIQMSSNHNTVSNSTLGMRVAGVNLASTADTFSNTAHGIQLGDYTVSATRVTAQISNASVTKTGGQSTGITLRSTDMYDTTVSNMNSSGYEYLLMATGDNAGDKVTMTNSKGGKLHVENTLVDLQNNEFKGNGYTTTFYQPQAGSKFQGNVIEDAGVVANSPALRMYGMTQPVEITDNTIKAKGSGGIGVQVLGAATTSVLNFSKNLVYAEVPASAPTGSVLMDATTHIGNGWKDCGIGTGNEDLSIGTVDPYPIDRKIVDITGKKAAEITGLQNTCRNDVVVVPDGSVADVYDYSADATETIVGPAAETITATHYSVEYVSGDPALYLANGHKSIRGQGKIEVTRQASTDTAKYDLKAFSDLGVSSYYETTTAGLITGTTATIDIKAVRSAENKVIKAETAYSNMAQDLKVDVKPFYQGGTAVFTLKANSKVALGTGYQAVGEGTYTLTQTEGDALAIDATTLGAIGPGLQPRRIEARIKNLASSQPAGSKQVTEVNLTQGSYNKGVAISLVESGLGTASVPSLEVTMYEGGTSDTTKLATAVLTDSTAKDQVTFSSLGLAQSLSGDFAVFVGGLDDLEVVATDAQTLKVKNISGAEMIQPFSVLGRGSVVEISESESGSGALAMTHKHLSTVPPGGYAGNMEGRLRVSSDAEFSISATSVPNLSNQLELNTDVKVLSGSGTAMLGLTDEKLSDLIMKPELSQRSFESKRGNCTVDCEAKFNVTDSLEPIMMDVTEMKAGDNFRMTRVPKETGTTPDLYGPSNKMEFVSTQDKFVVSKQIQTAAKMDERKVMSVADAFKEGEGIVEAMGIGTTAQAKHTTQILAHRDESTGQVVNDGIALVDAPAGTPQVKANMIQGNEAVFDVSAEVKGGLDVGATGDNTGTLETVITAGTTEFMIPLESGQEYRLISVDTEAATAQIEAYNDLTVYDKESGAVVDTISSGRTSTIKGSPIVALTHHVDLHIVDQDNTRWSPVACPMQMLPNFKEVAHPKSCKYNLPGAIIKLYNTDDLIEALGHSPNVAESGYVFESAYTPLATCTTDSSGNCSMQVAGGFQTLAIVKYYDEESNKTAYTSNQVTTTGNMDVNFQFIKTYVKVTNTTIDPIKFLGGSRLNIIGSLLTIVSPDYVEWSDSEEVYPFIFSSDSQWTVDVCMYVPAGYQIVDPGQCVQEFVNGETKAIIFSIIDVGSPDPNFQASFEVKGPKGKVTKVTKEIKGKHLAKVEEGKKVKKQGFFCNTLGWFCPR